MASDRLRDVIGLVMAAQDEDWERFTAILHNYPADAVVVAALLHQMACFAGALTTRENLAQAALTMSV